MQNVLVSREKKIFNLDGKLHEDRLYFVLVIPFPVLYFISYEGKL